MFDPDKAPEFNENEVREHINLLASIQAKKCLPTFCDQETRLYEYYKDYICGSKSNEEILNWWEENGKKFAVKTTDKEDTGIWGIGPVHFLHIPFTNICEHHWLPYFGEIHIAYLPMEYSQRFMGLSKMSRLLDEIGKGTSLQETLTARISKIVPQCLGMDALAVIVEAKHTCMMCRGINKEIPIVTTGFWARTNADTALEVMNSLEKKLSYAKN